MLLFQEPLTDINWNTIILAIVAISGTLITTLVGGVTAIILAKINNKATLTQLAAQQAATKVDEVAVKAEEVKTTLEKSDANTNKKLNNMHQLINSRFSKQLTISAMALRRIANESKNEEDEAAAVYAEKALLEHEQEQKEITDHETDCDEVTEQKK